MAHPVTISTPRGTACRCLRAELHLARRFNLAVAVIDIAANVLKASPAAQEILTRHPACLSSPRRIGLISSAQSRAFRIAIRRTLSAGGEHMLRADDGCIAAPLGLHLSPWKCPNHLLVSFHALEPQGGKFGLLAEVFDLTQRQLTLLEQFSQGLTLAQIAEHSGLQPQSVREAFSHLYAKFEVRGQLELMSILASLGTFGGAP